MSTSLITWNDTSNLELRSLSKLGFGGFVLRGPEVTVSGFILVPVQDANAVFSGELPHDVVS